jgi:hypothetical protein
MIFGALKRFIFAPKTAILEQKNGLFEFKNCAF